MREGLNGREGKRRKRAKEGKKKRGNWGWGKKWARAKRKAGLAVALSSTSVPFSGIPAHPKADDPLFL